TNVDGDSGPRQLAAIEAFAKRAGYSIVVQFWDQDVKGADPIETRPGFGQLLDRIEGNGVRIVLVEDVSRLAREVMTQELGIVLLIARGVKVFASNGDELTETQDEMRKAMRQIAGVFAELEKTRLAEGCSRPQKRLRPASAAAANRCSSAIRTS